MRILIGGGLGFIGSNLAHECVKRGHEVVIVDSLRDGLGGNEFNVEGLPVKIILDKIEQSPSWHAVNKEWSDLGAYDVIFNLAGNVDYVRGDEHPLYDQYHNATLHLQFLEDCVSSHTKAHIIFTSSRMVYGNHQFLTMRNEFGPFHPANIYGIHKLLAEHYYRYYAQHRGLKTTIARLTNPYGPRCQMKHNHYGILNWFIRLALDNDTIPIYGDGQQWRDYLYIDDVTQALLKLAELDGQGEVYNVGYGSGVKFIDMVKLIIAIADRGRYEMVKPDYQDTSFIANIGKIEQATGWTPQVDLIEGIERTVDYYRQYRDHYWTKEGK